MTEAQKNTQEVGMIQRVAQDFLLDFEVNGFTGSLFVGAFVIMPPLTHDNLDEAWLLYANKIIAGCRTFPNGDPGVPDESELVEIGEYATAKEAMAELINRHFQATWDAIALSDKYPESKDVEEERTVA